MTVVGRVGNSNFTKQIRFSVVADIPLGLREIDRG